MSEEMFIGIPNDEFPHCPVCGEEMIWFENTLVCKKCDNIPIADLIWSKNQKEKKI
jgi:hypothetical protein